MQRWAVNVLLLAESSSLKLSLVNTKVSTYIYMCMMWQGFSLREHLLVACVYSCNRGCRYYKCLQIEAVFSGRVSLMNSGLYLNWKYCLGIHAHWYQTWFLYMVQKYAFGLDQGRYSNLNVNSIYTSGNTYASRMLATSEQATLATAKRLGGQIQPFKNLRSD